MKFWNSLNRQVKTAFFVAPILLVGGYILSDLYLKEQAKDRVYQLQPDGFCDVLNKSCILTSGDMKINVYDEGGITQVNATYQLDRATLFLVNNTGDATAIQLAMADNAYYWKRKTDLRKLIPNEGDSYKLRLIAEFQGSKYISEFYTQTSN